jgi:type IV pilus assembly protein PilB
MAEDLPIVRIVDTLLRHAIIQGASDIHIEPMEDATLVRYRIDGILHDAMTLPKNAGPGITARIKVLSNLKLDEKRLPQDGRFKMETDGEKVSFRVSLCLRTTARRSSCVSCARPARASRSKRSASTANRSNASTGDEADHRHHPRVGSYRFRKDDDALYHPRYFEYAGREHLHHRGPDRIPDEAREPDAGESGYRHDLRCGLRALLRQDPNIIMVGEIRDGETASLAINAALTGHIVLSTIHTNSAAGAIPRLMDMGVEPFLLVSTLRARRRSASRAPPLRR